MRQGYFLLVLIMSFMFFSSVNAEIQTLPNLLTGECINLSQNHPNITSINVTNLRYPDSSFNDTVKEMTTSNGFDFTYEFCDTNQTGTYIATTCGDGDGVQTCMSYDFKVTNANIELTTSESIVYVILSAFVFLIFLLSLWGSINLPWKNKRADFDDGRVRIIGIQGLKYFKLACIFITYMLAIWLSNLIFTLSNNLIILTQFNGFFQMVFEILTALAWPVFVIMLITFFVTGARDLQLEKLLSRGINPKT